MFHKLAPHESKSLLIQASFFHFLFNFDIQTVMAGNYALMNTSKILFSIQEKSKYNVHNRTRIHLDLAHF